MLRMSPRKNSNGLAIRAATIGSMTALRKRSEGSNPGHAADQAPHAAVVPTLAQRTRKNGAPPVG